MGLKGQVHFFLVFLGALQSKDSPCKTHICLTWTFKNHELVLSCKPYSKDDLDYRIEFHHQGRSAFCVPKHLSADCRSFVEFGDITQNNITKETVFRIYGQSLNTANGRWTCTFGTSIVNATTEVTIPDTSDNTNKSRLRCWQVRILWTLFAFVITLGIIRGIVAYKDISEVPYIGLVAKKIATVTATVPKPLKIVLMFSGFFILLFGIPIFAGMSDEACKAEGVFSIFGIVMGVLVYVILGIREAILKQGQGRTETGNNSEDAPANSSSNDPNEGDQNTPLGV